MTDRYEPTSAPPLDRRTILRAAVGGAAILLPRCMPARAAAAVGTVEEVKGDAYKEIGSEHRRLDRAAPLFINDLVGTGAGSRAALHLGRDTIVYMGEEARLTIDRYIVEAGGEITLHSGPILYDHREGAGHGGMQIRSTYGQIAVRGTRFFAGPSNGVFGVFVERGSIALTTSGARVVLEAGQGSNVARPGADPTPPAPWKPERIRAALASAQ